MSFLSTNQYTLSFSRLPNLIINLQQTNLPGISLSYTSIGTPFSYIKEPDTKLQFSDLRCVFKVDENLDGYLEIYNWLMGLGFPENFDQYNTIGRKNTFADAILNVYTNTSTPNLQIKYVNCFPTSISDIEFGSTNTDIEFPSVMVNFAYEYTHIAKVT